MTYTFSITLFLRIQLRIPHQITISTTAPANEALRGSVKCGAMPHS